MLLYEAFLSEYLVFDLIMENLHRMTDAVGKFHVILRGKHETRSLN